TIGDNKDVVYETGVYNLTQPETPILVHAGEGRTETYLLTRLEAPEAETPPPPVPNPPGGER
ncbi:MAG TPA: hypothetical protein VFV87_10805, partial [Pirellulaceae bacterium]|nr:hypothetical protein [Pirellulaceae bacterium]